MLPVDSLGGGLFGRGQWIPLDNIFIFGEEKADKVCPSSLCQACGGQGRIERLLTNEELEVSEEETMVGHVDAAPAVFPWPEEEE